MSAFFSRPLGAVVAVSFLLVALATMVTPGVSGRTANLNLNFPGSSSVTVEEMAADETLLAGTVTYPQQVQAAEGLITMAQNGGKVIDWNSVRNNRHAREGHEAAVVNCVADLFQVVGAAEGYLSHANTVNGMGGSFPALAFAIPLDRGLKDLGNRGCVGVDMTLIEKEFGKAPKGQAYSWRQFRAVAVFGRILSMPDRWSTSEKLFPVSAYFVYSPKEDMFTDWLCRWQFLSQFYPMPRAVNCMGRVVGK